MTDWKPDPRPRVTRAHCPKSTEYDDGHSFYDYSYYGYKHPVCRECGYEDVGRDPVETPTEPIEEPR